MFIMSDREYDELRLLIINTKNDLSYKIDDVAHQIEKVSDEVKKSHEPRLKDLEQVMPSAEEAVKIKEIIESFGNWRFLFKFFSIMGAVISFFVTISYIIVKIVKAL